MSANGVLNEWATVSEEGVASGRALELCLAWRCLAGIQVGSAVGAQTAQKLGTGGRLALRQARRGGVHLGFLVHDAEGGRLADGLRAHVVGDGRRRRCRWVCGGGSAADRPDRAGRDEFLAAAAGQILRRERIY